MYKLPVMMIVKSSLYNTWTYFFRFIPEMLVLLVVFAAMFGLLLFGGGENFSPSISGLNTFGSNVVPPTQFKPPSSGFIIIGIIAYIGFFGSFLWVLLRWNRHYLLGDEYRNWVVYGQNIDVLLSGKGTFWRAARKYILIMLLSISIMILVMVVGMLKIPILSAVVTVGVWLFFMNFVLRIYILMPAISVCSEYGDIIRAYELSKGSALRILGAFILVMLCMIPAQFTLMLIGMVLSALSPTFGGIVVLILGVLLYFFFLFLLGSVTSEIFGHLLRARMQEEGIEPEII